MESVIFYTFAIITVGLSCVVILHPNAIGAAIALVGAFFGVAVIFALLHAHFIAVMQILLYAGAIMVFFVFVVMLLNLEPKQLRWRTITGGRLIGGSGAVYLGAILLLILWGAIERGGVITETATMHGSVEEVGELLLSKYVVPFEMLSILLVVAIVGAVVMGKKKL
jgi:NADH-quinone oxidoreductase subunit J